MWWCPMGVPSQALTWHDAIMLCSKILYFPQEPAYNRLWAGGRLGREKKTSAPHGLSMWIVIIIRHGAEVQREILVFPSKDEGNCFVCVHCMMLVLCGYKLSCTLTSKSYCSIFQLLPVCPRQDFCRAVPEIGQKTSPLKK